VWHIIVSENLFVCPMLVSEHAAATVEAVLLVVEGSAVLGLQFLVVDLGHEVVGELVVAMSEFALLVISTHSYFNPVFAKLSLVFNFLVILHKLRVVRWELGIRGLVLASLEALHIKACCLRVEAWLWCELTWLEACLSVE